MIQVIKIIDEKNIVLNAGSDFSEVLVKYGDVFEIYEESKEPMIDPFSGRDLGKPLLIKAKVTPIYINTKLCICQKANRDRPEMCAAIGIHFPGDDSLNVCTEEISGWFDDVSTKEIHVGDYARRIIKQSDNLPSVMPAQK